MTDMDIYEIRQYNFTRLLEEECEGRNMIMADTAGLDRTAVSRYKKGPEGGAAFRIGRSVAQRIEGAFGKEKGWMDHLHLEADDRLQPNMQSIRGAPTKLKNGGSYPILHPSQIKEFVVSQKPPKDVEMAPEALPGLADLRGFAIREETDQFEPTIENGSIYHVLRVVPSNAKVSKQQLETKLSAYFVDGHFVIGKVRNKPMGKKELLIPESDTIDITDSEIEPIGYIVQIDFPFSFL